MPESAKRRKIGPITLARAEAWKCRLPALVEELKRRQQFYLDLAADRDIRNRAAKALNSRQPKHYDVLTVRTA
jgi:hypothetical protein